MTQGARQRNLFAAEDFTVAFDSFRQSNFKAYDYDTIRNAMVDYIRTNYPENFNDWIKSSEFVALIELIAFLGHNLAFRADLSIRENFLSTAERRDSVLKIADFLGYNPIRSVPASGYLKITSVSTNQPIFDSRGKSLKNRTISFADNNLNTYQDFIIVMNEIFSPSTKFGNPFNSANIDGIQTEIYKLNNVISNNLVYSFRGTINGLTQTFEIHNIEMNDENKIIEPIPNPASSFKLLYRNDRQGIASKNTGFFFAFKQGVLTSTTYNVDDAVPNLVLDLPGTNINNNDIWVQNIDNFGFPIANWEKIDRVFGFSQTFNNLPSEQRKLYSAKTTANDSVSIMFGDGIFSEIPRNSLRVWYRTGLNQSYTLNPDDVGTVRLSLSYIGGDNNIYTATFNARLQEAVNNASARETLTSIKENAGRVFATQDRMITANDYSTYPVRASSNIRKIKSINRTHSGHSRYIDINDPTAQYQTVDMFVDDGYIYNDTLLDKSVINLKQNISPRYIYDLYVSNIVNDNEILNFYYNKYQPIEKGSVNYEWQQVSFGPKSSNGYLTFVEANITKIGRVGRSSTIPFLRNFLPNSIVEFEDSEQNTVWARVISIYEDGLGLDDPSGFPTGLDSKGRGAIILNKKIPDGVTIKRIFQPYKKQFDLIERNEIIEQIQLKNSFGLRYDANERKWKIIIAENLSNYSANSKNDFSLENAGDISGLNRDKSWLVRFDYSNDKWNVIARKFRIVFASLEKMRFYNKNDSYKIDTKTNKPMRDRIRILDINRKPNSLEELGENYDFYLSNYFIESDGYTDDKKIIISIGDVDNDEYPDNPLIYQELVGNNVIPLGRFTEEGYNYIAYDENSNIKYNGRDRLKFQWTRVAENDKRIDPSVSNIIDTFVLTQNYDTVYRNWLAKIRNPINEPLPPTTDELSREFGNISNKKSISDTVIYRPVKYKLLFGELAEKSLQAKFRIVKATGTSLNDGEIKSQVAEKIREFFSIDNWNFGETFYFTELAAYVHSKLSGIIGSIVIVPIEEESVFGNLFQVTPMSDELFIPDVTINEIEIVNSFTESNLRLRRA
jgi:hypothetical protein